MSAYSDASAVLQEHIVAMGLKVSKQLTESSLSIPDIDALESSLEQNVRRPLRYHRNSRLPCNRIPPEVVIRIAHYCSSPTFNRAWFFCLLKSTHLCRRWREIITSCPSLWTLIRLQPPMIASIFLERSGDLPLDIYTLSDLCYGPDHLRRIRTLRVRTSSLYGLAEIFSRLTVPSPVVTQVIIDVTHSPHGPFPDLPPLFGDMSTIQSLSLDGLPFNTKLLSFMSLTSLDINTTGILLPPFFDLLALNPALKSISISVWSTVSTSAVRTGTRVIPLNNLVTLHCRDASMQLLSTLSLPASTSIQIEDTGPPLSLSRTLPTPITNIRCLEKIHSLHLTTTTGVDYPGQTTDTHSVQFAGSGGSVDIHWVEGYDGPRRFDPHPLSLDFVKEMSITHKFNLGHPRTSKLDLSLLFNATKSLEVLRIHMCSPTDCRLILSPFYDDRICPSLHTVEIVHRSRQTQRLSVYTGKGGGRRLDLSCVNDIPPESPEGDAV